MNNETPKTKRKNLLLYNLIFLIVCGGIFFFLYNAPEETTKHLPNDEKHARFMKMDKKEAEKSCEECHSPEGEAPLPKDHPPKYRCLFCHKRDQ
jgi:cytochrome c553